MYSFKAGDVVKKTAKGVPKAEIKNKLGQQNYKDCIFNNTTSREIQHQMQSFNHNLHNVQLNNIILSSFNVKRYILDNGISSSAYGDYWINGNGQKYKDAFVNIVTRIFLILLCVYCEHMFNMTFSFI